MHQNGTGRCHEWWQGAAATAEMAPIKVGAIPNSGMPDSVKDLQCPWAGLLLQTSSRAPQKIARAEEAGQGMQLFCSPVPRGWLHGQTSMSWLGPGPALSLSKRLQEFSRAVPACVSPAVLPSAARSAVPLCSGWWLWDRWNALRASRCQLLLSVSQYCH